MALARAAQDAGQVAAARDRYQAALDLCRASSDESGAARALHGLGTHSVAGTRKLPRRPSARAWTWQRAGVTLRCGR